MFLPCKQEEKEKQKTRRLLARVKSWIQKRVIHIFTVFLWNTYCLIIVASDKVEIKIEQFFIFWNYQSAEKDLEALLKELFYLNCKVSDRCYP